MLTKEEMPACPAATTVQLIGSKRKLLILRNLMQRPWRFNELRRDLEGISQKVLTDSLRSMEEDGILTRTVYPEVPPRVEYALSGLGQSLRPIIEAMAEWGQNYKDRFQVRKTDRNALLRSPGGPQIRIRRRRRGHCRAEPMFAWGCGSLGAFGPGTYPPGKNRHSEELPAG